LRNQVGRTPLHIAAYCGFDFIVNQLLEASADPTILDGDGISPFDLSSNPHIRKLLEDYNPSSKVWKWIINPHNVIIFEDKVLGQGHFGTVYLGELQCCPVAVKSLKTLKEEDQEKIRNEVGLMSDIRHPNIVLLMGFCEKPNFGRCIVTEFIAGGTLRDFIQKKELKWGTILKCGIDIGRALAWLHSREPPIFHRDLHTKNILVTENGVCKVSDFGVSHIQGFYKTIITIYPGIRPPEITKKEDYSKKSDVYMYGMVLCELLRRKSVRIKTIHEQVQVLREECINVKTNDDSTILTNLIAKEYIEIIEESIVDDTTKRPEVSEILKKLSRLIELLENKESIDTFPKFNETICDGYPSDEEEEEKDKDD